MRSKWVLKINSRVSWLSAEKDPGVMAVIELYEKSLEI